MRIFFVFLSNAYLHGLTPSPPSCMSSTKIPVRESLKILLLNPAQELLLICYDDPATTSVGKKSKGRFWTPVGGKIEEGEDLHAAAYREIYEETGIAKEDITLGPIVWYGDFKLNLSGVTTHLTQQFMVGHTSTSDLTLAYLTTEEKDVVKELKWVSLPEIRTFPEIIYPVVLRDHIAAIMQGKYPNKPMELDLGKSA